MNVWALAVSGLSEVRGKETMGFVWSRLIAACCLLAAVLGWWFPEPVLIRGEIVDWAARHERRYTPPEVVWGVMEAGRAFIRSVTPPEPLTEFISSQTRGRTLQARGEAWGRVFASLPADLASDHSPVGWFRPAEAPFAELTDAHQYVEFRDASGIRHMDLRRVHPEEYGELTIPDTVRYPLRGIWIYVFPALVLVGILVWRADRSAGILRSSSDGTGEGVSAGFMVGALGLILWPFLYRAVGTGFSFASIIFGGLIFIGGGVGLLLFGMQVAMLKRLIDGRQFLAHFTYTPEQWRGYAEWNFAEEAGEKKALWLLVFVISLVIGLGFMAVMRDEASVWVFGFLMGLMALLLVLAVYLPRRTYRQHLKRVGEVYIGDSGLYLNGSVHSWNLPGARLESAAFETEPIPHIGLIYSQIQSAGRSLYFFRQQIPVRIPVPAGQEEKGRQVADALMRGARGR